MSIEVKTLLRALECQMRHLSDQVLLSARMFVLTWAARPQEPGW
jgi:hypothetical protein